jgi:hypothetical protein
MEEDVLGTREEAIGDRYVTCTACGRTFPREVVILADRDVPEETYSAQAELCPDCRRERELGEENIAR